MDHCLFCKIVAGEIPSKVVYEDDLVLAFEDIDPQAPVHILVIPKRHKENIMKLNQEDGELLVHMLEVVQKLARDNGLAEPGFRIVINTGNDGGQTVPHIHIHLLGGRGFGWPPG